MKTSKRQFLIIGMTSLGILGSLLVSWLFGYRFFTVVSPSMGETAPVGSLVVTRAAESYAPHDIITFYRSGRVYTHRIQALDKDGFITKGDLNQSNDPLPVANHDIIGKTVFIGKYLGWLWKGLPMLLIGWLIVYLISTIKRLRDDWRWPIRLIGGSIVVIITTFILNPWLHVDLLSYTAHEKGGVNLHVVNTGVFPIRDDKGGRFHPGQTATIRAVDTDAQGRFVYIPQPSLGAVGLALAFLWCIAPLVLALCVKLPHDDDSNHAEHWLLPLIIITLACIVILSQLSSYAAFAATVRNATNTSRVYPLLGCGELAAAMTPRPWLAYAMVERNTEEPDIAGNNRNGRFTGALPTFIRSDRSSGCAQQFNTAAYFNGADTCLVGHRGQAIQAPNTFSIEVWFATKNKPSSKMVGFGNNGNSAAGDSRFDRTIYIDSDGRVVFGVFSNNKITTLKSPEGRDYADGHLRQWHHAVATVSSNGAKLYVDGRLVDSNAAITGAQSSQGHWKIGCGGGGPWPDTDGTIEGNVASKQFFAGRIQLVSIYHEELTEQKIQQRYQAGR